MISEIKNEFNNWLKELENEIDLEKRIRGYLPNLPHKKPIIPQMKRVFDPWNARETQDNLLRLVVSNKYFMFDGIVFEEINNCFLSECKVALNLGQKDMYVKSCYKDYLDKFQEENYLEILGWSDDFKDLFKFNLRKQAWEFSKNFIKIRLLDNLKNTSY